VKSPLAFGKRHEHATIFKSILHADHSDHWPLLLTQRHRTSNLGIEKIRSAFAQHHAARKTGDLLRLTLVLPALVGNGTAREIQLLNRIGLMRGLAYQAADDLKDVLGAEEQTGKTASRDQTMDRPNLIMAEGFQATLRRFSRLRRLGDRMQAALPGSHERWGMLAPLRVTLPVRADLVSSPVIMNAV